MPDKTPDRPEVTDDSDTIVEGELPPPISSDDLDRANQLVEVFRVADQFGASAVIDEILAPAGIEAFCHDRRSHALPVPSVFSGEVSVAVDRSQAERARKLIHEARTDGALPGDGEIID